MPRKDKNAYNAYMQNYMKKHRKHKRSLKQQVEGLSDQKKNKLRTEFPSVYAYVFGTPEHKKKKRG